MQPDSPKTDSVDPNVFFPERLIITLITEPPGALAVFGAENGMPLTIQRLPNLALDELLAPDGLLTTTLHATPDLDAIAKVVVNLPESFTGKKEFLLHSRSGVGYLVHLLRWLKVPTIVMTTSDWRPQFDAAYGKRGAVDLVKEHFPPFFEEAYDDEQCAEAAMLSYLIVTNPKAPGIELSCSVTPRSHKGP